MSAYSDLILSRTSLLSYLRMGETVGSTTVADSKGAITGTLISGITLGNPGLLLSDSDTCAVISSGAGRITCGDVYPFTGTSPYSLECWIRPDAAALTANAYIFDNSNSQTAEGWQIRMLSSGALRHRRLLAGATDDCVTSAGVIVANTTYHVVTTYDSTNLRIYVDAILRGGPSASSKSLTDPAYTLTLGNAGPTGGNMLTGSHDEYAIYDAALTLTEIEEHYNAGIQEEEPATLYVNQPPIVIGG